HQFKDMADTSRKELQDQLARESAGGFGVPGTADQSPCPSEEPPTSASDVAKEFFAIIKENADAGQPNTILPDEAPLGVEIIKDEMIYLDVFTFDFATYLAFGQ